MAAIQIEHNRISSGEMLRTGEEMEGGGWKGEWKGGWKGGGRAWPTMNR